MINNLPWMQHITSYQIHFYNLQVDLQGLQKQIDEKKTREEEEKKIDEAYRLKQTTDAEIAKRLERNIEEVLC